MAAGSRGSSRSDALPSHPEGTLPNLLRGDLPLRTVVLSAAALSAAVAVTLIWPEASARRSGLVWILAVVPLFLFLYHRGWKGMAVAAAGVMVVFVASEVAAVQFLERTPSWWMYAAVVGGLVLVTVGAGAATAFRERGWRDALDIAYRDPDTGLPSRRFLDEYLRVQAAAAKRGRDVAVVLFSLDEFEALKDRWGIGVGERYLRQAGAILRRNLREQDVAGRFGGSEFLAILAGEASAGASVFAERVRSDIAESLSVGRPAVTTSAGVAAFDDEVADESDLLAHAEDAVLRAKKMGGDRVILFGRDYYREGPVEPHFSAAEARTARRVGSRGAGQEPSETDPETGETSAGREEPGGRRT